MLNTSSCKMTASLLHLTWLPRGTVMDANMLPVLARLHGPISTLELAGSVMCAPATGLGVSASHLCTTRRTHRRLSMQRHMPLCACG